MLQLSHIKKSYTTQLLFDDVTITLSKGERLGFVGRNGSGKSTLFRLITGEEEPDSGEIIMPNNYRIGSLKQHIAFTKKTVLEECCLALPKDETHEQYKAEKILAGLGFSEADLSRSPEVLSGGFQVRLLLAKVLLTNPDLLLLDEPTNYLDIVSIRWLKNFLKSFPGELIIITHDRGFMDEVTTHTMGLSRNKILKIKGTTEKYYEQLALDDELYEKQQKKQEQAVKKMQHYIIKYRATARRSGQARSREKKLSKMKEMFSLEQDDTLSFLFNYKECPAKVLQEIQNYTFTYPGMDKMLINDFSLFVSKKDRIGIIGKNGAGKSTLLNLMAGELHPKKGTQYIHPEAQIALFGQMNINRLHENNTIEDEIMFANNELTFGQAKSICGLMMFERDLSTKKISVLSGGERSRVLLGKILAKPVNLLLLDEPTNHLDHESIEGLLDGLENFNGGVAMVTHSEMILRRFATRLIIFQGDEIINFEGTYDDFLRRIGWDDEEMREGSRKQTEKLSKKELRQQRAYNLTEKNQALKPLKTRVKSLENKIHKMEKDLHNTTEKLVELATTDNVEEQVALSKRLKDDEKAIDKLYGELVQATRDYEEAKEKFS